MIIKNRDEPIELYQLQSLYKRIPDDHIKKATVLLDLKRKITELKGLKAVDFPLQFIQNNAYILHDIRLEDEFGFFQLDILLLTPKGIVILEVKNWYGTLIFEENDQVIRINENNEEEGFANPILQVKLQTHRLKKWLNKVGLLDIPIMHFIIISFPSTIIKSYSPTFPIPEKVFHSNKLILKFNELMKNVKQTVVSSSELSFLAKKLIAAHTPKCGNVLEKYGILESELIKGVFCPQCEIPSMLKGRSKWVCRRCNYESSNAHLEAINDYKWLISDTATNKDLREFLKIDCIHVMKRMMKKAEFMPISDRRNRKYKL